MLAAFPKESQKNIQRELIREKKIPHGRDGYSKSPALQDVTQAAENEVQAEFEEAYITTNFAEANKAMQKTLDKKKGTSEKREKMVEENPPSQLEGKVENLTKMVESLVTRKLETPNRETQRQEQIFQPWPCLYCDMEGHKTYNCPKFYEDECQGLVHKRGRDFFLPNNEQIPYKRGCPIQ